MGGRGDYLITSAGLDLGMVCGVVWCGVVLRTSQGRMVVFGASIENGGSVLVRRW